MHDLIDAAKQTGNGLDIEHAAEVVLEIAADVGHQRHVLARVKCDRLMTVGEQAPDNPGTDHAETTSNEEPHTDAHGSIAT